VRSLTVRLCPEARARLGELATAQRRSLSATLEVLILTAPVVSAVPVPTRWAYTPAGRPAAATAAAPEPEEMTQEEVEAEEAMWDDAPDMTHHLDRRRTITLAE